MSNFTIEVRDDQVHAAFLALEERVTNAKGFLGGLGEDLVERTKRRFETSTGPDGVPWLPNSAATLMALGSRLTRHRNAKGERSYAYSKQGGLLNGKGLAKLGSKKPLIDQGELRRQIVWKATADTLTVGATPLYAAIQQFGGQAGRGLKVTIPARPYLPVRSDETLYPEELAFILDSLNEYIAGLST